MPTVDVDRDTAHDAAQRELSKPIYPKGSASQRFSDWLDELLYRIIAKGSQVPGGWFTITVLLILVIVAVVVAVRVARRTMRTDRGGDYALFGTAELSAAEHRATAEQYAARGEWAAAIRHRLRAVARQLEETGVLDPVPGRTSYELARAAAQNTPLSNFAICSGISHMQNMSGLDAAYAEATLAGIVNTQDAAKGRLDSFAKGTAQKITPDQA